MVLFGVNIFFFFFRFMAQRTSFSLQKQFFLNHKVLSEYFVSIKFLGSVSDIFTRGRYIDNEKVNVISYISKLPKPYESFEIRNYR